MTRGICYDCPDTKSHALAIVHTLDGTEGKPEGLCARHAEAAGLENDHRDNGHDEPVWGCPLCGTWSDMPDLPPVREPRKPSKPTGRTQVNTSHAACTHEATKAARAACRRARAKAAAKAPEIAAEAVTAPTTKSTKGKRSKKAQDVVSAVIAEAPADLDLTDDAGADYIVARVAEREQELEDAFEDDDALLEGLSNADLGC